jgi:hypothetical protein
MAISGNPGAIPDVDEYQPQLAAQQVRQPPESAPQQPMAQPQQEPQPQQEAPVYFRDVVGQAGSAVQQGIAGLKRIFLGGGQPQAAGIPTEEGMAQQGAMAKQGAQRFARGEGAATPEELQAIDYSLGIDNVQADEGTKQMIRLDRTVNYYLEKGDKDKAEAVAASLLQAGAVKVRNAAQIAQAAFNAYQQTGDPRHLQAASKAMQKAHQLIPDGFDLQLDVDPKTHQLVATTTDSEGKANRQVIDPRAVPQLLQKAMDGSAYWKSVFRIGHPTMAAQEADDARSAAAKQDERAYNEGYDQYKFERGEEAKRGSEDRQAERWLYEQQYQTEAGRSPGERLDAQQEQFFTDWNERLAAAPPEQKQQVLAEGLQYRFENARDRQQPVDDLVFSPDSPYAEVFDEQDMTAMTNIARVIAQKNPTLDGSGAMTVAAQMATAPKGGIKNNPDGTFNVEGLPIIFNPQLLPTLNQLRRKHGMAQ